jgi:hypothetical protein
MLIRVEKHMNFIVEACGPFIDLEKAFKGKAIPVTGHEGP